MAFNKELFFEAINQIAEQNLLSKEEAKEIIKESVFKTFKTKFDPDADLELQINEDSGVFKLINNSKLVVADIEFNEDYRQIEIPLSAAKKIKADVKEGDEISEEVDFMSFAKIISNQVKQLITQQVREKKKEAVYAKHKSLKGEMIEATVTSSTKSYVNFTLEDGTTAFMPPNLRNLSIPLNIGERVKVFVEDVLEESKDSQIIVSNGSPTMIRRLLEIEVPEIADGIVEIVKISRVAGLRSKVAVRTNDSNVDAVGAIIGAQGARINAIVSKLEGEKIDIINWTPNINEFVSAALSPAKVIAILDKKDSEGNVIEGFKLIITPNRHQTLAIGKRGLNARLAVELTNTRIDVISVDQAKEAGIEFEWNGNVSPEQVQSIESGERQTRTYNKTSSQPRFNSNDLDKELSTFNESISHDISPSHEFEEESTFDFDDSMFSENELKQMEANFEFDDELADFDVEEYEEDEDQ